MISSTSASERLNAAVSFVRTRPLSAEVLVVAASRGAADDFVRALTRQSGATFGLARFSVTELAARVAAVALADARRTAGSQAGAEAIAARATFEAISAQELEYFGPVASMPGFSKALARTLHELRLAGVRASQLQRGDSEAGTRAGSGVDAANGDIARLLTRFENELDRASVDDRAALFRVASATCRTNGVRWAGLPMVLLDVPLDSRAEREFVAALIARSPEVVATIPDGDEAARAGLAACGGVFEEIDEVRLKPDATTDPKRDARTAIGATDSRRDVSTPDATADSPTQAAGAAAQRPGAGESDLATLRRYIFTRDRPPERRLAGDVRLFSAPGEGREAVEIVRRALDEAAAGVPFDEMAVFLRTPQQYLGLLEHACARGGVPVYFDRGTRRPDPSGRAFVALVLCAVEGLSAKRFDEYLSLGQVPAATRPPTPDPPERAIVAPADEAIVALTASAPLFAGLTDDPAGEVADVASAPDSDDDAVIAGTLRSPWKWEELIVESAVVGGRTRHEGKARWRRRLDGLAADFRYRLNELRTEEPESPSIGRFERDLRNLAHLRHFALPIIDELADWPERAVWGTWLERFGRLATRALNRPDRVLQTLADLRPMSDVGPVGLDEAVAVLRDRIVMLDWEPPARRYGRLFVGTPLQARGRRFRIVFVPGLAERVVPQRPYEDPLLLDVRRRAIDLALVGQDERVAAERLLLKIAIGAATERLYLSYPRLDVSETRARVPSFYALDVMRAMTGRVPDHRVLASEAASEGGASLAWPAPRDPDRAIDDLEHDLAVLKPLLDSRPAAAAEVRGRAHYLLDLNPSLRRSVINRWARGRSSWSTSDGLIRVSPSTEAALAAHRLHKRPYSLSALQRFAVCPYQFLLATIIRLEPWDEPEPIVRMDPLTRGSLYHAAQAEFFRAMKKAGELPIVPARVVFAIDTLNGVLDRTAREYAEKLAPAIERVWGAEVDELRRDLGIWVRRLADRSPDSGGGWIPRYFEFSFGLSDEGRDPESLADPVVVGDRFLLRGSVDLIEQDPARAVCRVTDHKTGRNRSTRDLIVGGGAVLQPILYGLAVERGLGVKVTSGRLFYSTTAGGFVEHEIPLDEYRRSQGLQVLAVIDRAVEMGFLPAVPGERACTWCDFKPVCGPREEERVRRKAKDRLADLTALRSMR